MRYLLIFFFIQIQINNIYCQSERQHVGIEETYIFKAHFQKTEFEDKCTCEFKYRYPQSNKCNLFSLNIIDVYIQRDTGVYDSTEFKNIKYMVVNNQFKLPDEGELTFVAINSSSKEYLMVVDTIDFSKYTNFHPLAFLIGKTDCFKFNVWQKIQFRFGIRVAKIHEKKKRKGKVKYNPFEEYIISKNKLYN